MTYKGIELYTKGDQVAVLVSPGFGAGWSTWVWEDEYNSLAYDKRVIDFWLQHKDDKAFMQEIDSRYENPTKEETARFFKSLGYDYVYMGGFADIELEWVDIGVPWTITEYDGHETLLTANDECFITFGKDDGNV